MKIVEEEEEEVAEIQPDPLHQLILHFSHNALTERRWDGYESAFKQLATFFNAKFTGAVHFQITYYIFCPVACFNFCVSKFVFGQFLRYLLW